MHKNILIPNVFSLKYLIEKFLISKMLISFNGSEH